MFTEVALINEAERIKIAAKVETLSEAVDQQVKTIVTTTTIHNRDVTLIEIVVVVVVVTVEATAEATAEVTAEVMVEVMVAALVAVTMVTGFFGFAERLIRFCLVL